MDDNYINKLINDIQQERSALLNDMKNDTELTHSNFINSKLTVLDSIFKSILKLRNINIKEKIKTNI
jgi:protein-tyrosine phosphatase